MFNTGAHCNEDVGNGNINGDVESDSVDNIPSGLRVYVYAGRVRVEAWNFGTQTMYHAVEAPVTARGAATTEATTEAPRGVLGRDLPRSGAVSTTAPDIHGVVQPSYVQAGPPTGVIHV